MCILASKRSMSEDNSFSCFFFLKRTSAYTFIFLHSYKYHSVYSTLPSSHIHSLYLIFPRCYPFGAFFSSAEVLFVLYPLQSSEYFYMNISLTCTHTARPYSPVHYLTEKPNECTQHQDIQSVKCLKWYVTHLHRELAVNPRRLDQNDPDTTCCI